MFTATPSVQETVQSFAPAGNIISHSRFTVYRRNFDTIQRRFEDKVVYSSYCALITSITSKLLLVTGKGWQGISSTDPP